MASGEPTAERIDGRRERTRNRRGEGGLLRADLLAAAVAEAAQHGTLDKIGVRSVAAAVGVSPTAVYRHFPDRDALVAAVVEVCYERFAIALATAALSSDDPVERLRRAGTAYVEFAIENPGLYRVMFSTRLPADLNEPAIGMHAFDDLVTMVDDVMTAIGGHRHPARFVAVQLWTWIHGIVDLVGTFGHEMDWPTTERLLDELQISLGLGDPG